ncbi:MAG: efflux RND transporter periplasmic adaptor subunit, partial [Gemmatimonadetes bacterium]
AKVDIQPANPQSYFVIPVESLIEGDAAQGFVFAVDENRQTVRKLPIRMAYLFERHLAVSTGLEGIGQVVTEGAPYLSDGSIVQVVN